jgi:hypothetical protein
MSEDHADLVAVMVELLRAGGLSPRSAEELAPGWAETMAAVGIPGLEQYDHTVNYNPALIDALVRGLDLARMDGSSTLSAFVELREMAEAGLLVPSVVMRALRKAAGPPDGLFEWAKAGPGGGKDPRLELFHEPHRFWLDTPYPGDPPPARGDSDGVVRRQRRAAPVNPDRVVGGPTAGPADWYPYQRVSPPAGCREEPALEELANALDPGAPKFRPGVPNPSDEVWIEVTTITDRGRVYYNPRTGEFR